MQRLMDLEMKAEEGVYSDHVVVDAPDRLNDAETFTKAKELLEEIIQERDD